MDLLAHAVLESGGVLCWGCGGFTADGNGVRGDGGPGFLRWGLKKFVMNNIESMKNSMIGYIMPCVIDHR
nr:hypothetical protein [uncultured Methanoregula sp.]